MMSTRPHLAYSLSKEYRPGREVRHLLIQTVDGPGATKLIQLTAGVPTEIVHGTEYETRTKADELAREWTAKEGFEASSDNPPVFEPLPHAIALTRLMGHKHLYDDSFKSTTNFIGLVPIEKWPGMTAKNGGSYEYAYTGTRLIAQPAFPSNHGLNTSPRTTEETLEVLQKAIKIRTALGPTREFVLGD